MCFMCSLFSRDSCSGDLLTDFIKCFRIEMGVAGEVRSSLYLSYLYCLGIKSLFFIAVRFHSEVFCFEHYFSFM